MGASKPNFFKSPYCFSSSTVSVHQLWIRHLECLSCKNFSVGTIIKISKHSKAEETRKKLELLAEKNRFKPSLKKFYGQLPGAYGDGLAYQKKMRNEWD